MGAVSDERGFAPDLYRGTAQAYDRFRLGYPPVMIEDLLGRVGSSGRSRLLDLACGTGQLAFALADAFVEVWAVDQEPDMIRVVTRKAKRAGRPIRCIASPAEGLDAPPAFFDLITIGNAFHRLDRDLVAAKALQWLRPGAHLAVCWSDPPWTGPAEWQRVLRAIVDDWTRRLGAQERVPPGWERAGSDRPDAAVLAGAGFISAGRHVFTVLRSWRVDEVIGFLYATSVLSAAVVSEHAAAFEADVASRLTPHLRDGAMTQQVTYACELARRPPG